MNRRRVRWSRTALRALVLALSMAPGRPADVRAAQLLEAGRAPSGISVSLVHEPYELRGESAADILAGLRTLAPAVGWVWYPLTYRWRYDYEPVILSDGRPTNQCRSTDVRIDLDFRATYPVWVHPDGVSEELTSAWAAFEASVVRSWEWRRASTIARARQVLDAARRLEYACPTFQQRIDAVVQEAWNREPPERMVDAEPAARLRWPPEGFDGLLAGPPGTDTGADRAGDASDAPVASTDDPPELPAGAPSIPDPGPRAQPRLDVDESVRWDLDGTGFEGASEGFVLGIVLGEESQFVTGFDGPSATLPEPMTADDPFTFRAFTEVLVSALAGALAEEGVLDLDAPIRSALPDLDERLGSATLEQLLSHTGGLDNAVPLDSTAPWSEVLAELDDRALFTDPGILYSHSRYSYGMAVRVIEAATGTSLDDALRTTLLDPLGLGGTTLGPGDAPDLVEGLPATRTTARDLADFWRAWWDGRIPGSGPDRVPRALAPGPAGSFQAFHRGVWVDWVLGAPRLTLVCHNDGFTDGFHVLPEQRAMIVFGSHGSLPLNTGTFVLSRFGEAFGVGGAIYGPGRLSGGGIVGEPPERCQPETFTRPRRPADFGPMAESGDWAGRYINGDRYFALEDRDGELISRRGSEPDAYRVHHFDDTTYFVALDDPRQVVGFPIELLTDHLGRRYVVLDHRAYLHEDDRGAR